MKPGLSIIVLGGFFLSGGAIVQAKDWIQAPDRRQVAQAAQGVWVGSVEFTSETAENHVEHGDLEPGSSGAATQPGSYDAAMRRLQTQTATIQATPCVSGLACAPTVRGAFRSSERSDANRQSRWPRDCPGGAAQTQSVRSVLNVRQTFRNKRGPAPGRLSVSWDVSRKIWVVDASLLPGAPALPVCDDMSNEVESVDPGCGEPPPPPKTMRPAPSTAACAPPTMGRAFTVSAPPDATRLTGAQTLESSNTPDNPPSGAVRQRNGSVGVESKVVYDLTRIDSPASD